MTPNHTISQRLPSVEKQRLPSVEKQVDVIKKSLSGFFLAGTDVAFNSLSIWRPKEALDHSIVMGVSSPIPALL